LDRDIAERGRIEKALRASEEKLALAFRTSPYAIIISRINDGRVIDVNDALYSLSGFTPEEVAGRTARELSLWADEEDRKRLMAKLLSGQRVTGEEIQFRRKDGQIVTGIFSADVFLLRDQECILSSITDITDRKRLEDALKLRTDNLARSNAELERFAYVASHDLQEPLRMVASFTQLLARRYAGKLDAKADEYIGYAVDGAKRMQQLIADLLALSRVGTRGGEFRDAPLEDVISDVLLNLGPAIQDSGAAVTHNPLPTVVADRGQMAQLLQNLIGNAVKFRDAQPPRVHISAVEAEAGWTISMSDNGIGIAPEHAERVFQIFQRLHTRDQYPGTGIGLAVCRKIAERHGGKIWLDSTPGAGTTFHFTLPTRAPGTHEATR
jgi:PAS domain S-box-containing protein